MLRNPAFNRGPRGIQKVSTATIPAPVGGWNSRDPLAAMPSRDAVLLENWFPSASEISVRFGASSQATGFISNPGALLAWNGPTSYKLFASTNLGIFDVSAVGAIGAAVAACTNAYWQHVNFTTPGGSYLVAVNGIDKLKLYDGTTWFAIDGASTPAITGLATTSLTNVAVMVSRLWFVGLDSTAAWYLPVASVGGALTKFDLGTVFTRGGHLVAMHGWTLDGGNGQDDYSVFISSEGEVAVYKGTDPASATTWAKVGTYYVGQPLGKNCLAKFGGDLLILSKNGLFPLSKALATAELTRAQTLSFKIDPTFIQAARDYGSNLGWDVKVFPSGGFVLVNVPITTAYSEQYVMSTTTSAWCKFSGWTAYAWIIWQGRLFYAGNNSVNEAWVGTADFGQPIVARAQQAYSNFGLPGRQKHFKLIRPIVSAENGAVVNISLDIDYQQADFPSSIIYNPLYAGLWDTATWDVDVWANDTDVRLDWETAAAYPCFAAGLRLQVASTLTTISWSVTNFTFIAGGIL